MGSNALTSETCGSCAVTEAAGNVERIFAPTDFANKYETIRTGIAPTIPINITKPKSLPAPTLDAAASGPGVGGTSVCVVYNPEDSANVYEAGAVAVFIAKDGISLERIIKPESQKTGIPTTIPINPKAKTDRRAPNNFSTPPLIDSIAPVFSSRMPSTEPNATIIPIC